MLARIADGGARRIEAKLTDQTLYDLPPGPERTPAFIAPTVFGPPAVILMNLPAGRRCPGPSPLCRGVRGPLVWIGANLAQPFYDGFMALPLSQNSCRLHYF